MKKKNMKALLTFLVIGLGISLVSSAYFMGYMGNLTGSVIGGDIEDIQIALDFQDFVINVSEGDSENSQMLIINNLNGETNMSVLIDINKTLLDQNCSNYEEDCEILFYKDSTLLSDGDNITLYQNSNYFSMNSTCIKRSCLQEMDITFELAELI